MYTNRYRIVNKRRFFASIISVLLLVIIAFSLLINLTIEASDIGTEKAGEVYIVQEGDTLWSIASKAQSKKDIREVVSIIKKDNTLASDQHIQPGQTLYLPYSIVGIK